MGTEDKKIYLTPTRQLLLTLNVIKGTVAIEDFQLGLGDGTPKDSLGPFELTNELARVNLEAMEWKIIGKNKIYELKIKTPDVCAKKIKEIGLYYSEKARDAKNNSTLIAYSYQAQARHEDKGEELTLQLVLPHSKEEEMENPKDSSNSVTIGESRLIDPAPAAVSLSGPVLCYVRDEAANRCLISSKKVRNVHQNGYGRYELWIDSIEKDQIVIGTSFPGWKDKYFNVPKGHILVAGNGAWYNANSWRIRKETSQIVTVEEDAKDEDLEQKLKKLVEELKGGKDDNKKDLGMLKELVEKLKGGKDDNKKDFGQMLKELVEELKGGKDDNKKDFGQMLKELVEELKGGKDDNNKNLEQRLKKLEEKLENKEKKELEERLNELEEKQERQSRDLNTDNSCCSCCSCC